MLLACASCAPRATPSAARAGNGWDVEIAPPSEPGERLVLAGVVRDASGRPLAGATIHAYHSDARGNYVHDGGDGKPALEATFRSGPHGEYRIRTIVPGLAEGAPHVHFEITPRHGSRHGLVYNLPLDPATRGGLGTNATWSPDRRLIASAESLRSGPPAPRDVRGVRRISADLRLR